MTQDRIRLKVNPPSVASPQGYRDFYVNADGDLVKETPGGGSEIIGSGGASSVVPIAVADAAARKLGATYVTAGVTPTNGLRVIQTDLPDVVWTLLDATDITLDANWFGAPRTDADGALSIAKTSGLQTALDAKAPRWVFPGTTKNLSANLSTATPKFVVIAGDSLSTNLSIPPAWADAGQFGVGRYDISGTASSVVASDSWITGAYVSLAAGSTVQFHPTGGADAAFMATKFAVGYLADSGAGGFDVEASSVQVSSGAWTKMGSTQNTENATLIGKYTVFDVPSTSNSPQYKFRITNITGKAVKLVVWGYYTHNQGGVVTVRGMANMTGRDVSQWALCTDAVFAPIWTGIAPDLVVSRWADGGADWDAGGAFDVQYARIKTLKPSCDFAQLSMGPVYGGPLPLGPQQTWPAYYPSQSAYRVGDFVKSQVDATGLWGWYICTTAHTQSADKKPGQGASWASYWSAFSYDPEILASGAAAVTEQVTKQADWAYRNTETFIETGLVFGSDYPTSFARGLTSDFVHPTTTGWAAINAYWHNMLPLARSPELGPYSNSGPLSFGITGSNNQARINRGLRISAGSSSILTLDASDGGTDNTKKFDIGQTADVASLSVSGQAILKMFRSSIGQHSLRPGGTPNVVALGDSSNVWRALYLDKTITAIGTTTDGSTGAQTISKPCGSIVIAAGATSANVTNSLAVASTSGTTGSVITATVRSNDTTMKSVAVVCSADGSFTLFPNAAPTAATRVDFAIITP